MGVKYLCVLYTSKYEVGLALSYFKSCGTTRFTDFHYGPVTVCVTVTRTDILITSRRPQKSQSRNFSGFPVTNFHEVFYSGIKLACICEVCRHIQNSPSLHCFPSLNGLQRCMPIYFQANVYFAYECCIDRKSVV